MSEEEEKNALNAAKLVEFEAKPVEKAFVDEYFRNGYNATRAALAVKPDLSPNSGETWARSILKKERVKLYLKQKQAILRAESNIEQEQILKELLSFAYSDVTTFIGLTPEELKSLPSDIRRCIHSMDTTTKTWLDPKTKQVVKEVTVKLKLVDKLKAIDMISKHINFYEADNRSKSGTIDLSKATNEQLNTVLDLIKAQQETKQLHQ